MPVSVHFADVRGKEEKPREDPGLSLSYFYCSERKVINRHFIFRLL